MSAVPTVYAALAQIPVDADIGSLRLPLVGASPLPSSVREAFARHTGQRLLEGYGLTEATCVSTWTRPGEERPGSVGRALPGQQVKAVRIGHDGSWADCAPGETGVLAIAGPAVFAGYVTDPRLGGPRVSRDGVVRDGWLDTGDLGSVDADGFAYLTGRAKDLIIRGGHNIDPRVIEEALLRHPTVRAAAAVGRPDRHAGEIPVAYVVPAGPGQFDETELLAWAGTAIGEPAARPKHLYPVDAIPVTAVGKQFKPALAADAAVRAVTEALAAAALDDARATAAHEDGRLVITVTGADPGQVRDALAGFALTVRRKRGHRREHPTARHRRRRRPGRLHRRPPAGRLRDPGHRAGTAHGTVPAAARSAPGRRGRQDPRPDRRERTVPGPVPAGQRASAAGRQAPRDGRVPP
jgi:fatty-acyl-CoA synthase